MPAAQCCCLCATGVTMTAGRKARGCSVRTLVPSSLHSEQAKSAQHMSKIWICLRLPYRLFSFRKDMW